MSQELKTLKLPSGYSIPTIGLGTWQSNPGEVEKAVKVAFECGYRHIDCAYLYQNEGEIGEAIKYAKEVLKIPREEIFITSKLWNTQHNEEDVEPAIKYSLEKLGIDYLDLYLIHFPMGLAKGEDLFPMNEDGTMKIDGDIHPTDTWLTMEKLVEKGLTKSIGVSNFNSKQIQDILDKGTIKPACNQIEVHPYFTQDKLVDYCTENDIPVTAYSPLASPANPWAKPDDPKLLEHPELMKIGEKYGKSVAQVIIRWHVQRGLVVLPKSVTPSRIKANIDVYDFELTKDEMEAIFKLNNNWRVIEVVGPDGTPAFKSHPHYPF